MPRMFQVVGSVAVLFVLVLHCAAARQRRSHPLRFDAGNQPAVVMINGLFDPQTLTVKRGTTVEWINNNGCRMLSSYDDSFKSDVLKQGDNFQHTFERKGTYRYRCQVEDTAANLSEISGTIVVTK